MSPGWTRPAPWPRWRPTSTPSCRPRRAASRWPRTGPTCTPAPSPIGPATGPGRNGPSSWAARALPETSQFCPAELGGALRTSDAAAAKLIADALDLRHRLPRTWAATRTGQAPAYQARYLARSTRHLTPDQARWVDTELAPALGAVPFGRLQTLTEAKTYAADPAAADAAAAQAAAERFVRLGRTTEHGLKLIIARATAGDAIWFKATIDRIADILGQRGDTDTDDTDPQATAEEARHRSLRVGPPPFDPARARPRAVVYLHLSAEALTAGHGLCRSDDLGPVLVHRLRTILGERCQILLKPVIDLNNTPAPIDAYEIPSRLREHLRLRQPADIFPYAAAVTGRLDLDHATPYQPPSNGGPPGQTRVDNLGPLTRRHHRIKTFGGWQLRQPEPDTRVWRSPHGRIYLINPSGTHPLGHSPYAQRIWHAATGPPTSRIETYLTPVITELATAA